MAETTAEVETPKAKRSRLRAALMGVLIVITSLSIVVAATTTWAHQTVFNTDRWLEVVGPLPQDPEVATAIARFAMNEVSDLTDLRGRLQQQLPAQLAPFVDPVLNALRSRIQARLVQFIESDQFGKVWVDLNRFAHDAVVKILRGQSNRLLTGPNGEVRLNLVPLIYRALTFLQENASFVLQGHSVPTGVDPVTDPQAAVAALATEFGRPLDPTFAQPVVFQSDRLAAAQSTVHLFDVAFWVALFLPLVLIAIALVLSRSRRRTAVQLAVGAVLALILTQAIVGRLKEQLANAVAEENRGAVRDTISAGVHGLEVLIVWCVVIAIVVAVAMYLIGRPAWFMWVLGAVRRGWESDPSVRVQRYIGARPTEFAWGGFGIGVIGLWIAGISWLSFVIVALLVAGWVALVEYLRRRYPTTEEPGPGTPAPTTPTAEAAGQTA
jgi:hypothetical protein